MEGLACTSRPALTSRGTGGYTIRFRQLGGFKMSTQGARSVSMALVGALASMLFIWQGLLIWAGFVGWAAFLDAGGDSGALTKTIAGTVFGAFLAWAALILNAIVTVPAEGWLWIPRIGVSVAATLLILALGSRTATLSRLSTGLLGYAVVFGATATVVAGNQGTMMLLSPHQGNPLINAVLSMVLGTIFGLVSNKLTEALSKK
jgi:hypothetical protein